MPRISDALELLTAQHDEIEVLLTTIGSTESPLRRSQLITELTDLVTIHLAVEQELFYPVIALDKDVHAELIAEHGEIKRILADLLWRDHDDDRVGLTLSDLRGLLSVHSTWQERDLFESVAERHTPAQLAQLGEHISGWIDGHVVAAAA